MANYVLGSGKFRFDKFVTGTTNKTGERYLGNTIEVNIGSESETLDHYDTDNGLKQKDDTVQLAVNRSGTVTSDNIDFENLALFFLGETSTVTQTATPVVGESLNGGIGVKQGLYYQLGATAANPPGVRGVSAVAIKDAVPTTYTVDVDYVLDAALGTIYIVPGGGIADDTVLLADYTPAANSRTRVISSNNQIAGAARFVSKNAKGLQQDFYLPYVLLTPNGEYALKGDDWTKISFKLEVLKLNDATEAVYIDGRPA